jgi:hypothetical protein
METNPELSATHGVSVQPIGLIATLEKTTITVPEFG